MRNPTPRDARYTDRAKWCLQVINELKIKQDNKPQSNTWKALEGAGFGRHTCFNADL